MPAARGNRGTMNVINPALVAAYCEDLAEGAARPWLGDWLRRNLRNHILRTPSLLVPVSASEVDSLAEAGLIPEVPAWLPAAVERGDALGAFRPDADAVLALGREVGRIVDHGNAIPDADWTRVSLAEAASAATAWEAEQSRLRVAAFARAHRIELRAATAMLARGDPAVAKLWPEGDGDARVLAALSDGHALVELLTRDALRREGSLMDHCVASYDDDLVAGRCRILSLRDPANMPLATLEVGRMRAGALRILGRFLPKGMAIAVQIRGPHNHPLGPGPLLTLADAMDAAGVSASDSECRWLGLPDRLRALGRLDLPALAAAMPGIARDETGPNGRLSDAAVQSLQVLAARAGDLPDGTVTTLAVGLAPDAVPAPRHTSLCEAPAARSATWIIPNLMLTAPMTPLAARAGDAITKPFREAALAILAGMSASPRDAHAVQPAIGAWRDPLPFFAWCGLAAEWVAASEASRLARRAWLDGERHAAKTRLRDTRLPDAERTRLQNVVSVQIPRLLAACAPPAPRPAPAPARKPPAFRLPTRPAPRRRA